MEHTLPGRLQSGLRGLRALIRFESDGLRTAFAVMAPLIAGQMLGRQGDGIMVALGGLYVAIAGRRDVSLAWLCAGTPVIVGAAFLGSFVGGSLIAASVVMFLWAFLGAALACCGETPGHLGYVSTLVLAIMIGLPANLTASGIRAEEFLAGGVWAILLTFLFRLPPSPGDAAPDVEIATDSDRTAPAFRRAALRHALHRATASALAVTLAISQHLEHGAWLALTVLVIVKPDYHQTRRRAMERIGGSLLGGIAAIVLAAKVRHMVTLDVLLFLLCLIAFSHLRTSYRLYVVFLTPFVVLMLNMIHPGDWQIALVRIGATLGGGALALITAFLFQAQDARDSGV